MREFLTIFLALLFETTPFLLAGVAISVLAGPWLERVLASAAMRQPALGIAAGTGAGLFLPMCDCGSRPLAHRLALAGRREFAIAFMVAAPVINPIVVVTTWLAFHDVELLVLRLGVTAMIAALAAIVISRLRSDVARTIDDPHEGHTHAGSFATRMLSEFAGLFQYLVIGSALAAGIQVFVDQSLLTAQKGVYLSVMALMALAFLLSICSSVDAFVVAGLGAGLGTGPLLAFLTFGPIVNLKSMPLYARLFSGAAVAIMVIVAAQVAFVASITAQLRGW